MKINEKGNHRQIDNLVSELRRIRRLHPGQHVYIDHAGTSPHCTIQFAGPVTREAEVIATAYDFANPTLKQALVYAANMGSAPSADWLAKQIGTQPTADFVLQAIEAAREQAAEADAAIVI